MRAHPSTKSDAGGRTLSRRPFFRTDPRHDQSLLLPYQGVLVPTVVVDSIGGYYRPGLSAYDVLCRAEDGRYYLAREVSRDRAFTGNGRRPAFALPPGRHWLRVKRLSLRAALLHVTGGCGYPLRQDLWTALAATSTKEASAR